MNGIGPDRANDLFLANAVFFALMFVVVAVRAIRERRRSAVDVALMFGAMAALLNVARVTDASSQQVVIPLILAVPYLMLRLVADFATVPWWALRLAELVLAGEIVALIGSNSLPLASAAGYTAVVIAWSTVAFVRVALTARGVTRRRYTAIAVGNGAAVTTLLVVLLTLPADGEVAAPVVTAVVQICVLVVGVAYFAGFATPTWLRRLWRDAGLRAFLKRGPTLLVLSEADALSELATGARDAMGSERAVVVLPSGPGVLRVWGAGSGYEAPADQTFSGRVIAAGKTLVSLDPVRDVPQQADIYRKRNVKMLVGAPMRTEDKVIGALVAQSSHASLFAGDDLEMCQLLADQAAAILSSRSLIQERERQAERDPLTGLPNSRVLSRRLEEWIGATDDRRPCALLLTDLDAFGEIDQIFGHEMGDELLPQIAERLRGLVHEGALLARLTSDQFAFLITDAGLAEAEDLASRILRSMESPFALDGAEAECGASIGIAVYPDHATDPRSLTAAADVALSVAKRSTNAYAVYPLETQPQRTRRRAMRGDLRRAIRDGSIRLEYQPLVSLRSGGLLRLEALARWDDPVHGAVPPAEFIDLAERTGSIRALTDHVLRLSLADARAWRRWLPQLRVSVNLSARSLADAGLVDRVMAACSEADCPPAALELEITESVLMSEPERAKETVARLRDIGVTTAIDDFGTGYSSLAYLQRLPVSGVKIDHHFTALMTADERSDAIVRATIRLAHELGFEVVAEGIADRKLWDLLAASGCDVGQGFYIGRPMAAGSVRDWLRTWTQRVPARPPSLPTSTRHGQPLVLIVDDDPAIVSVTRDVLKEHGYAVATASNGEEALALVARSRPDAVLLDIHMPVLDGNAFAETLRERGVRTPLVVMTSGSNAEVWARRIGASGHLAKPFAIQQLLAVTRHVVRGDPALLQ